jgi:hypothetical protein
VFMFPSRAGRREARLGELPPESTGCCNSGDQREDGLEDQARVHRTIKASSSSRVKLHDQNPSYTQGADATVKLKRASAYSFSPDTPSLHASLIRGSVPPRFLQLAIASFFAASELGRGPDHPMMRLFCPSEIATAK